MAALPRRAADAADQSVASSVASCWQRRPGHPAILAARLAASTAAREVMRSTTAVRQRRASWKSAQAAANVLVRELYGLLNGQDSRRLFADHGNRLSQENGRRFGWSEAGWWAWEELNQRPHPDPKIHDEQAGGNTRLRCAEPGLSSWVRAVSGGGFEGDLVAEGLQLADVVALGALSVDAGVVEAGAQVLEPCGRVG
jgi:hypothetical protein